MTRDLESLLAHIRGTGISPVEVERRWDHLGALITDAALQPRAKYKQVVLPRVQNVIAQWPDAATLEGFQRRLATEDLEAFLPWRGKRKTSVIRELTAAFEELGVATVQDLAESYDGGIREAKTRQRLSRVKFVGPKTLDYLAILAGSTQHVAVDSHIQNFVWEAGVARVEYTAIVELIKQAAAALNCSTGALDAAIWTYMSERADDAADEVAPESVCFPSLGPRRKLHICEGIRYKDALADYFGGINDAEVWRVERPYKAGDLLLTFVATTPRMFISLSLLDHDSINASDEIVVDWDAEIPFDQGILVAAVARRFGDKIKTHGYYSGETARRLLTAVEDEYSRNQAWFTPMRWNELVNDGVQQFLDD